MDGNDISGNAEPFRVIATILGFRDASSQYRAVSISMDYLVTYIQNNDPIFAIDEVNKTIRQSSYNGSTSVSTAGTKLETYLQQDSALRLTLDSNTAQIMSYRWQIQIIRLNSQAAL